MPTPSIQAKHVEKLEAGDLVTDIEAAAILGIAPRTLRNWRPLLKGPKYVKIGARTVRYRRADLAAFIEGDKS